MLSWSSQETDTAVDEQFLIEGTGDGGLQYGGELAAFVDALGGYDDAPLEGSRSELVAVAGREFMHDAAAVAANFEMMTRVADGTGARFGGPTTSAGAPLLAVAGFDGFASKR